MEILPLINRLPDLITVETNSSVSEFTACKKIISDDVTVTIENGSVLLTADETELNKITLRWNETFPDGTLFCGDNWERGYGDFEWRGFVPHRVMPWYFFAKQGDYIAGYGVKVRPDALCFFTADKSGITLCMDVRSGASPVKLDGKQIKCAEFISKSYSNRELLNAESDFASLMADGKGVFPDNPVYGFNNWYYAYGHSSAEEILENSRHLARLTRGLKNPPFMVIDDGWQKFRNDDYIGGPWREGNPKFPDMKLLAEQMSATGVIPGIWMRPTQNKSEDIPDDWYTDKEEYILDVSKPEVLGYIADDIKTLCGFGYKLIKHDYSTRDISGQWGFEMGDRFCRPYINFTDKSKTTAVIIKDLYKTIYDAAAGKALILGCNTVGHLGVGYMEINRTGDDTSGFSWERTRKMGFNTLAYRLHQHNSFYFVDADCSGLTKSVAWEKNRQWLEILAKSGTPLFVSVAPDTLEAEQEEFLKDMLLYASGEHPIAVPVDIIGNVCPEKWNINGEIKQFELY